MKESGIPAGAGVTYWSPGLSDAATRASMSKPSRPELLSSRRSDTAPDVTMRAAKEAKSTAESGETCPSRRPMANARRSRYTSPAAPGSRESAVMI